MSDSVQVRVGDEAKTASTFRPGGIVVIAGQRFSARSGGEVIEAGVSVLITGGDNHGFTVEVAERVSDRESLPDFGKAVYSNFGSSKRAKALQDEESMRKWLAARSRWIRRIGPLTGGLFAILGVLILWRYVFAPLEIRTACAIAAGMVAGGALCGFLLLWLIDGFLRDVEFALYRLSLPSLGLLSVGFVAGTVLTLPHHGTSAGLMWGFAGAILCGLPLPVLAAFFAVGGLSDGGVADVGSGQGE